MGARHDIGIRELFRLVRDKPGRGNSNLGYRFVVV